MEQIVRTYTSFAEADAADLEYYRRLTGDEKLQLFLELVMPEIPDEALIERSARVYPLSQSRES
jgi:hypothetical protein